MLYVAVQFLRMVSQVEYHLSSCSCYQTKDMSLIVSCTIELQGISDFVTNFSQIQCQQGTFQAIDIFGRCTVGGEGGG